MLLALTLAACVAAGAPQMPVSPRPTLALTPSDAIVRWVDAIRRHAPNRNDAPVIYIRGFTGDDRLRLAAGIDLFLSVLEKGLPPNPFSDDRQRIVTAAHGVTADLGAQEFFRRAMVLHTEVGLLGPPDPNAAISRKVSPSTAVARAIVWTDDFHTEDDGELVGEVSANWNWEFARALGDELRALAPNDPFVSDWYHAVAAFFLRKGWYGEARTHVMRYTAIMPASALAAYDRASYDEILGLPRLQALVSDADSLSMSTYLLSPTRKPPDVVQLGIPPADRTNADAERLYRQALGLDPRLTEARVRLGRLLQVRGRDADALKEFESALSVPEMPPPVRFYAHLFAARAARETGDMASARAHAAAARALFPRAQSARLLQSEPALMTADISGALAPLDDLGRVSAADDPWIEYSAGPGREAKVLLDRVLTIPPAPR